MSADSKRGTVLMVADSERDANMLHATGLFAPDAFIYLKTKGEATIFASDLEIDRARRQSHCRVEALSAMQEKLRARGARHPGFAEVIVEALRQRRARRVMAPENFPLGLARQLEAAGVRVTPRGDLFSEREFKTAEQARKISASLRMAEAGMAEAMRILRASKIGKGGKLMHEGRRLTSERVREGIDCAILQAGGLAAHTIVAGGRQACDPHECGHGPLRANELIILDIFPRAQATGYFGDITRTVVRGRASEAARRLYGTVLQGQRLAFGKLQPGAAAAGVHHAVEKFFEGRGYRTGRRHGRMEGFFHGTGHGLGLEIHEAPRVGSTAKGRLKAGQVVTVEPGLYYPEIGGARLEDVAWITASGAKNLTRFEKRLEI